jgi:ribosomal protein S18 acetylase RimI-like enzyme
MLEEMMADYLENQESQEIWLTAVENEIPIALAYCAPEKLTEGTFNLYAIGVKGDIQGKGIGAKLMTFLENQLQAAGHRILIVDTSGTADFELTRRFYEKLNYHKEAVIRDFWADGDDKVTYWKRLN